MRIADKSIDEFLKDIATKPCTPAGGCIAALCAASAAALIEMVARHTLKNKDKSDEVADYMEEVIHIASEAREKFLDFMDIDTQAYKEVIDAQKNNDENLEKYYKNSANIPLEMAKKIFSMIEIIKKTTRDGSEVLVTDGVASILMAKVTLRSLIYHIKFNLMYIRDQEFLDEVLAEIEIMEEKLN